MSRNGLIVLLIVYSISTTSCSIRGRINHSNSLNSKRNFICVVEDTLISKLFNVELKQTEAIELYKTKTSNNNKSGRNSIYYSNGYKLNGKYDNGIRISSWELFNDKNNLIGIIRYNSEGKILMVLRVSEGKRIPIIISQ